MKIRQHWAAVGILALSMGLQSLEAAVIYTENFLNTTGSDAPLNTVGWLGNHGATGISYNSSVANGANPVINSQIGAGSTTGFVRMSSGIGVDEPVLLWTSEIQANPTSVSDLSSASFFMRNQVGTADVRLALQVGSIWYVTTSVFNTPTTTWLEQTVDFSTATWNALSFTSGSTLSMGTSAVLPSIGTVNGIGFFMVSKPSAYISFDDITVTAVPEPSTVLCLVIAALVAGSHLARRKRA